MTKKSLKEFLSCVRLGEAVSLDGLTLVPLITQRHLTILTFCLLKDALKEGQVTIKEVGGGSIPKLEVEVHCEEPVLALQGTILQDGKQNRTLNISLLLESGKSQKIPVSCVERRRWYYRSHDFHSYPELKEAYMAHILIRHYAALTGHASYRETDQIFTQSRWRQFIGNCWWIQGRL